MTAPVYSYEIADLRTNVILEEVVLHGVSFSKPLNSSGRFDGSMHLGAGTSHLDVYDLTMPARRAIYAYRDGRPMWGGIIWTRQYDSTTRTVLISAGEWWSYFDHRKVLPLIPADPDLTTVAGLEVSYNDTDQNSIARALVTLAQSHTGGDIQVEPADLDESIEPRDRTYRGYDLVDTGEALRQLAGVIDGPDMCFDVAANPGGAPRRVLRLGTPYLGQQGSAHRWETSGNVLAYRWSSDGAGMATRTYAVGEGVDHGTPIAVAEDTAKYESGFPVLEYEGTYSGAEDESTLDGHAEADQAVRRMPVALITLVTRGDISPTAAEVDRGDDGVLTVHEDPFHRHGFEGPVRVVNLSFRPGVSAERVELTMAPLLDGVA